MRLTKWRWLKDAGWKDADQDERVASVNNGADRVVSPLSVSSGTGSFIE